MANSASNEPDLRRVTFVLSPEERALGSSLENDLHPLYRRLNFRASALTANTTGEDDIEPLLEAQVYERIVPALRLASLLLDFTLPFYAKVFCADLIFVGQQYAFDPRYKCTDADIHRFRDLLLGVSDRNCFYRKTSFIAPISPDEAIALAVSEVRTGGRPFPTPARSLISISERTNEFFSQEGYEEIDAETKTSQLVQLAFVLVHEQAHALFNHKWAEYPELTNDERDFAWIHRGSILSRGRDFIFVEYPGDVLSESTSAETYTFRGTLLSADFWRAARDSPRPSEYWNKTYLPQGWLGRVIEEYTS